MDESGYAAHRRVRASAAGRTSPAVRSATRLTASALGAIGGMAGIEHGIGEALQGNVAPPGVMFLSWGDSPLFRILGGEPAMTVIPNLLITGILSIFVGILVMIWSIVLIRKPHAGPILILLSVAQLLVGGGLAPIPLGILAGVLASRIGTPLTWWRAHLPAPARRVLATLWTGSFIACVTAWLSAFPGLVVAGYLLGMDGSEPEAESLLLAILLAAIGFLLLTVVTGFAHDLAARGEDRPGV